MSVFKQIMSFVLAVVLTVGMLPPVRVSASETETAAVEETVFATETAPVETTVPAVPETVALTPVETSVTESVDAVVVTDDLGVYSTPSGSGDLLYSLPAGTVVTVVRQETVMDVAWGYMTSPYAGWILMDGVQVGGEIPPATIAPTESTEPGPEPTAETTPAETEPAPTEGTEPDENAPEATGICGDDLTWAYDADTTTLTISGSGPMWDYAVDAIPEWVDYLEITTAVLEEGITHIGDNAFVNCYGLTNVVIPDGVESIGDYAFFWCEDLLSLELPKTVTRVGEYAFACCTALTSVTLPDSLTDLGQAVFSCCEDLQKIVLPKDLTALPALAFEDCIALTSVTLPDSLTDMGQGVFSGCESLQKIVLPKNLTVLPDLAFEGCMSMTEITWPETLLEIGDSAFMYCDGLETVILPDSLQTIGTLAFKCCDNLKSITIPEGITTLPTEIFRYCPSLESVSLPTTLRETAWWNFMGCNSLKSVVFSEGLTTVAMNTFQDCPKLESVFLPESVTDIFSAFTNCPNLTLTVYRGSKAEEYAIESGIPYVYASEPATAGTCGDNLTWNFKDGTLTISGSGDMYGYDGGYSTLSGANQPWAHLADQVQRVHLPEGLASIGHNAFRGFAELTQISIPGTVISIGEAAFGWCTSLTEMTLPEGVKGISCSAFVECTALTTVTLPKTLEVAGPFCFDRCTSLSSLTFLGDVPDLNADYFLEGLTLTAYYPALNPTWTADKLLSYGGNITWVPYGTKATQLVIQGLDPDSYQGQMIGREDTLSVYAVPSDAVVDVEFTLSNNTTLEITGQDGDSCTVIPRNPGTVLVTATDKLSGLSVTQMITIVESTQITVPFTDRIPITDNAVSRYYSFTPTVSGRYVFTSANCELNKSTIRVESLGSGNLMHPFDNLDDTVYRTYADLTAGETYQIRPQYMGMTPGKIVTFTAEYQPSIPDVTEIRMSADNIRCNVLPNGTHFRVLAELLPAGSKGTVTWESSDETVAEIKSVYGNACYIVPQRIGTATLTARCNGLEASTTIIVEPADVLKLNQPVELDPEELYSLQVLTFTPAETGEYVFKADVLYSDPYIMDLLTQADGTYVPLRMGYGENGCEEYAELQGGETYNLYVGGSMDMALQKPTVTFCVKKAAGAPETLHLKRIRNGHEQISIGAYFGPENTYEEVVNWEVDNGAILEYVFDSNNEAYFNIIGKGTATITATSASGLTGSITVNTDPCSYGHRFGQWTYITDENGIPNGQGEYRLCSVCGEAEFMRWVSGGNCSDNADWYFDRDTGTLTITGTGDVFEHTTWRDYYANDITTIVVEEGITGISDYAFSFLTNLKSVHLADSVTKLGDGAFAMCVELADVTLSAGITEIGFETFRECLQLKEITIPAGVTTIETDAFRWCSAEKLHFTGNAPVIGENAFYSMTATAYYPAQDDTWTRSDVTAGSYGGNVTWKQSGDLSDTPHIPQPPEQISASGTWGDNLTWKLEPNGKLTISGTGEMMDWMDAPEGMNPDNTFPWKGDYMNDILEVVVEEGVTSLAHNALSRLENLRTVTLPDTLLDMGDNTFTNCYSLTSVSLGSGLTRIGQGSFTNCALTELVIPGSVELVDCYAFSNCEALKTLVLKEGVREIARGAFRGCEALSSVTLPDSLRSIDKSAFEGCASVQRLTISANIQKLGRGVFYGCDSLRSIAFAGDAPAFDDYAFLGMAVACEYPDDNPTWTADVLRNYGGDITWYPAGSGVTTLAQLQEALEAGNTSIRITGQISLKSDLTIHKGVTVIVAEGGVLTVPAKKTLYLGGSLVVEGALIVKGSVDGNRAIAEPGSTVSGPDGSYATRNQSVTGLTVTGIPELAAVGSPVVLEARVIPADAWNTDIRWSITDGLDIAKINQATGEVTASAPGTVTVRVEAADGSGVWKNITISFAQTHIAFAEGSAAELTAGKSASFKIQDLATGKNFKSFQILWELAREDAPFADLTAAGKLTAYKTAVKAEVTLTARVKDHPEYGAAEHKVRIYPVADRLEILQNGQNVNGQTIYMDADAAAVLPQLRAALYPADARQDVTWTLSKTKIASVDPDTGEISWNGIPGTVTLTATARDGSKQKASVTICFADLAESITIDNLAEGQPYLVLGSRFGKPNKVQMKATTVPADAGVVWSLAPGDEAYATITADGKLTAKKVYDDYFITVIATTKDGQQTASCQVQIIPDTTNDVTVSVKTKDGADVTGSTVNLDTLSGGILELQAFGFSSMGCCDLGVCTDVDWESSNPKVASVQSKEDGSVIVTVHQSGTAKISAECHYESNGKIWSYTGIFTIKGVKLTDTVTISEKTGANTLAAGKSLTLKAALAAADGKTPTTKGVTWSLAEGGEAYAKITAKGKLTANAGYTGEPVTVTVLAESKDGGAVGEYPVTIHPIARGMRLYLGETEATNTLHTHNLQEGTALRLTAAVYPLEGANQAVTWKSSNKKIAEVDPVTGDVICRKPGTVTITATASDGSKQKASFKLTLIHKTHRILLEDAAIAGGKTLKLKPVLLADPETGALATSQKVTWTVTGDAEYVTLNSKGVLKTKKVPEKKTVYLTATAVDAPEVSVTCRVEIYPAAVQKITFWDGGAFPPDAKLTLYCGDGWDLYAQVTPEEACGKLVWKSSDPSVVRVDSATGEFLCLKPGKATLTASAVDGSGKTTSIRITVK